MKVKTTRKAIVNGSYNVKCAGYCDLSYLLNNHSPLRTLAACMVGILTFTRFTALRFAQVIEICRAQGFKKKISEYEEKARAILSREDKRPFEEKQIAVENLLKEFCKLNEGVIYE